MTFRYLLFLFICCFSFKNLLAQPEQKDQKRGDYRGFGSDRHFSSQYWMLGLYAGTENFQTISFGINFPIINQNMPGRLFTKRRKETEEIKIGESSFVSNRILSFDNTERFWIPTPIPKRLSLTIGVERELNSLVYRPEIGLVATPFSLNNSIEKGNKYLNHILLSTEYVAPIRNFQHHFRIGAGYMLKLNAYTLYFSPLHGVRFYFLYHYNFSKDWSGHMFTLQLNYNREPNHYKYNPIKQGYHGW